MTYISQRQYKKLPAEERERIDREEEQRRREARLEETLTREQIIEAIDRARFDFAGNGTDESDLAIRILDALKEAFE